MIRPIHARNPKEQRENAIVDRALGRWRTWLGTSGVLVSFIIGGVCGFMIAMIVGLIASWGFGLNLGGFPFFSGWFNHVLLVCLGAGAVLGGLHSIRQSIKAERARMDREDAIPQCACGYSLEGNTTGVCPECGQPRSNVHSPTSESKSLTPYSPPHSEHRV